MAARPLHEAGSTVNRLVLPGNKRDGCPHAAVSASHMPVGSDCSLLSLRPAPRAKLGNVGETFRLKEFLLFYREDKDCFTDSAFHFNVLELLRNDHTDTSV